MARPYGNRKRRGGSKQGIRPGMLYWSKVQSLDYPSQWAYNASLDGADEFESNEGWGENSSLLRGPFRLGCVERISWDSEATLNRAERRFIRRQAGCIVHEDSQGFLSVDWRESAKALEIDWARLSESYDPEPSEDDPAEPDD